MRTISITSGKGGVGKTTITSQLGLSLAELGKRVLILDADMGMSNVDIMFGIKTRKSLYDVVHGESIDSCIVNVRPGLDILSGGNGISELTSLNAFERREILDQVQRLEFRYDFVLIDNSPGLHDYVLHLNAASDEIIIVLTHDVSSFADAYSLVKVLHQKHKRSSFKVITNQIVKAEGIRLFGRFSDVVEKFMTVKLSFLDSIPHDDSLKRIQSRLNMQHAGASTGAVNGLSTVRTVAQNLISEGDSSERQNPVQTSDHGLSKIFRPMAGHA